MHAAARPALALLACILALTCAAVQQQREWSRLASLDLRFIRDTLGENHPGPVDSANPGFREWFEQGFEQSLELAVRAENFAGYYFAIQHYMQGFQDGHLGAFDDDRLAVGLDRRWPGFLLALRGNRFEVAERAFPRAPKVGARLVSCDGRLPETWAETNLQKYIGLWSVRGARPRLAPYLLIDEGNPFVPRPSRCVFEREGRHRDFELDWQLISNGDLAAKIERAMQHVVPNIGLHRFGGDGFWITLSSFNAGDDGVADAIAEVLSRLGQEIAAVRDSQAVVFDVRGNRGGNSAYGNQVASALWGEPYLSSRIRTADAVEWRASPGNLGFVRDFSLARSRRRFGEDSAQVRYLEGLVRGLQAALARGDTFYREAFDRADGLPVPNPVRAAVFLLTDSFCGSACLDFADVVLSLDGVTHIGLETSADAIYIDNRSVKLPSGLGRFGFSMKVYRGRPRGHNQSYVPTHVWSGRMDDTAALEQWVLRLLESG